jgi:hypothetical protein
MCTLLQSFAQNTNGPLLAKMAYELWTSPVIGKVEELLPLQLLSALLLLLTVIEFASIEQLEPFVAT